MLDKEDRWAKQRTILERKYPGAEVLLNVSVLITGVYSSGQDRVVRMTRREGCNNLSKKYLEDVSVVCYWCNGYARTRKVSEFMVSAGSRLDSVSIILER